jgi:putative ATPase
MDLFVPPLKQPLSTRMRPTSLNQFIGQEHLMGEGKMIRRILESKVLSSLIFYGPASCGKTTLAFVMARELQIPFEQINAVLDGVKDLRVIVEKAEKRRGLNGEQTLLFVDEIHRWNKSQQDALLPHIESGLLLLIGATTENPYYSLVSPLLSRCQLFELFALDVEHVKKALKLAIADEDRGFGSWNIDIQEEALNHWASFSNGDIRNALNALEMAVLSTPKSEDGTVYIDVRIAEESIQKRQRSYDRTGDQHYHYASAFIKSLRGSDVDASLYWMAAMLEGGEDPMFIFRRLLIFASEDIGLAEPYLITAVESSVRAFEQCGMPEGLYFLSQACIHCALAPKSNSTKSIFKVLKHIQQNGVEEVPEPLKDRTANRMKSTYEGKENPSNEYLYPHDYPNHWVAAEYLPKKLNQHSFYEPGSEGREVNYWERIQQIKRRFKS